MNTILRAGLLGLATGARSTLGITAQVAVTPGYAQRQPEKALGTLWVKGVFGVLALTEIVADKLPSTPSRLEPPGIVPRVVLGAGTAVLVARAEDVTDRALHEPDAYEEGPAEASLAPGEAAPALPAFTWPAVAAGAAASVAGSFLGHAWRGWAAGLVGRDWPGALLEDALAIACCWAATRP